MYTVVYSMGGHGPHGGCPYTYTPNDSGGSNTLGNYMNHYLNPHTYVIPMDIYIIPIHNVNHNRAIFMPTVGLPP